MSSPPRRMSRAEIVALLAREVDESLEDFEAENLPEVIEQWGRRVRREDGARACRAIKKPNRKTLKGRSPVARLHC